MGKAFEGEEFDMSGAARGLLIGGLLFLTPQGCTQKETGVGEDTDRSPAIPLTLEEWWADGVRVNFPGAEAAQIGGALCSIDSMHVGLTPLVIFEIRRFKAVSSHFGDTEWVDRYAYLYAGILTAGLPMTSEPYTAFYLYCDLHPVEKDLTFEPEGATLEDHLGHVFGYRKPERIYMSCPAWEFPLWRYEQGFIDGFLTFERLGDRVSGVTVRLRYRLQGERGEALYRLERRALEEQVPIFQEGVDP